MYEEIWSKTRDHVISITNKSDDYYEKYIKIKFNLDNYLSLKKALEFHNYILLIDVVRSVFHESDKN